MVFHGQSCTSETLLEAFPAGIPNSTLLRESACFNPYNVILGRGNNAFPAIVCADADPQEAAATICDAVFQNSFSVRTHWVIVDQTVYDKFLIALNER